MNTENHDWETLLQETRAEAPAVISRLALAIFPVSSSEIHTAKQIAGNAIRNLLSYIIRLSVQDYSSRPASDLPAELLRYQNAQLSWLKRKHNASLVIEMHCKPLSEQEIKNIFEEAQCFPSPPATANFRIRLAFSILQKLLEIKDFSQINVFEKIYEISSEWNRALITPAMQMIPNLRPLEFARMHVIRNKSRIVHHGQQSILWGKEFYESYKKYVESGCCSRTAKAKARRDFIKAHPPRLNDDVPIGEWQPGLSRPALTRYLRQYLNFLKEGGEQTTT